MLGLMQSRPLLISSILTHAARHHGDAEVVSKSVDGEITRESYRQVEERARKLARALQGLGVGPHDRVGTLAWNSQRHLEIYYAVQGMMSVCHTINPRLHPDDVAYIVNHAQDRVLMADVSFISLIETIAPLVAGSVTTVVMLCDADRMPEVALPPGMRLLCYETLLEAADADSAWPEFDEETAAVLCYTSGTTGRPKGVLYSHRSTVLHAMAVNGADALAIRAIDRVMPVVPMFHVNAWGTPYAALMAGASLVMPGRHLDGPSVAKLMNEERVTMSAGVPTVWMGLLQHLRASGERLHTVKRIVTGGSACPPLLIEAFGAEYGVTVEHAWGMTEVSPIGSYNRPKAAHSGFSVEQLNALSLKQGRAVFGADIKIVGDAGEELPWDGVRFGDLKVRGPWVCGAYYGEAPGSALDEAGWFATGDVATICPQGFIEITDRSKDVIKSGGEWISSIALENLAVSHPSVAEAAVISARHPKWDERPLLLVRAAPGCTVDPAEVMKVYEGQVPKWWLPDAVLVVDELPHTATGKLQKNALRAKYGDHLMPEAAAS
jgi:fatty-acyl-CoA synthase